MNVWPPLSQLFLSNAPANVSDFTHFFSFSEILHLIKVSRLFSAISYFSLIILHLGSHVIGLNQGYLLFKSFCNCRANF